MTLILLTLTISAVAQAAVPAATPAATPAAKPLVEDYVSTMVTAPPAALGLDPFYKVVLVELRVVRRRDAAADARRSQGARPAAVRDLREGLRGASHPRGHLLQPRHEA